MKELPFTALRLQQFRSYDDFAVELSPGVNIVIGPNGSGKTNLLEALLILCGVSSYRAAYGDLVNTSAKWARLDGNCATSTRVVKLTKKDYSTERLYEINNQIKKRLNFTDSLPVILFEPEDIRLMAGSPERRRQFFDDILTKSEPSFVGIRNKYLRSLQQRNRLLKNNNWSSINNQIFAWNLRLAELAGKIVGLRSALIDNFNESLGHIYSQIAQSETPVLLKYISNISAKNYESSLLHKLESGLETDLLRGFTAYGSHRDDIDTLISGHPAGTYASRGEIRTLVLSLKLLELNLLEKTRSQKPLILLDDVFSELDGSRRRAITEYLRNYQTVVTTTDADVVQKHFAQTTNRISLSN